VIRCFGKISEDPILVRGSVRDTLLCVVGPEIVRAEPKRA